VIEVYNYRRNGPYAKEVLLLKITRTLEEAARQLLLSELGWGGRITKSSDTMIEVATQVLSCQDRTTFEGAKEEMDLLAAAVLLWHEAEKNISFDEWWKRVSEITNGVPLLVKMTAPQVMKGLVLEELARKTGEG